MEQEKGTSIDQECIDDAEEITNRVIGKLVFDACYSDNGVTVCWDRYKPFYLASVHALPIYLPSRSRGQHGQ